ncbi:MAG TPA: Imm7 family immunity protein [Terricaulis sp.]|nr:Imm7 family immunity protein [Terricaulis sp.]
MFEFYLWLMVDDGPQHHWEPMQFTEDEEEFWREDAWRDARPERLRKKLEQACEQTGLRFENFTLRGTHGGTIANAAFAQNHPMSAGIERRFLEAVAARAPSSYGVIYTLNTDTAEPRGEFDVLKLANGKVTQSRELLVHPSGKTA